LGILRHTGSSILLSFLSTVQEKVENIILI